MSQAKVLIAVRGKFLKETTVNTTLRLIIFRNDERDYEKFEIQIILPRGHVYPLSRYEDEKTAQKKYEELLEAIKNSPKNSF